MAGKSPLTASTEQKQGLQALAASRDRGGAGRARAVLLTLGGWTSRRIAEAFAVREDTVRLWRSDFMRGGFEALNASIAPGPVPVKPDVNRRRTMTPGSTKFDPLNFLHFLHPVRGHDRRRSRPHQDAILRRGFIGFGS